MNVNINSAQLSWGLISQYFEIVFEIVAHSVHTESPFNPDGPLVPESYSVRVLDSGVRVDLFAPFQPGDTITHIIINSLASFKRSKDTIVIRDSFSSAVYRQSLIAELEYKRRLVYWGFG